MRKIREIESRNENPYSIILFSRFSTCLSSGTSGFIPPTLDSNLWSPLALTWGQFRRALLTHLVWPSSWGGNYGLTVMDEVMQRNFQNIDKEIPNINELQYCCHDKLREWFVQGSAFQITSGHKFGLFSVPLPSLSISVEISGMVSCESEGHSWLMIFIYSYWQGRYGKGRGLKRLYGHLPPIYIVRKNILCDALTVVSFLVKEGAFKRP